MATRISLPAKPAMTLTRQYRPSLLSGRPDTKRYRHASWRVRATIVNYLKESKERGIDIRVNGQSLRKLLLSKELSARYRLTDVYVAHVGPEAEANFSLRQTARVAAMAFHATSSHPGMSSVWPGGRRLNKSQIICRFAALRKQKSVRSSDLESDRLLSAEDCAIQIANRIEARCHTLHAPAVLSSVQLAESLRHEPSIKTQSERFSLSMSF